MIENLPLDIFPNPNNADKDGLIAYGGNLVPEVLLSAYLQGIFPWYNEGDPVYWWSPDPRLVLYPNKLKVSKSLSARIKSRKFEVRFNTCFLEVVKACAGTKRKGQDGTWITKEMIAGYHELHKMGFAQSVETFLDNKLVGGLYGLTLGRVFCGESMFHHVSDASKVAFYYLVQHLKNKGFQLIDAQMPTSHLKSLGAEEMPRSDFLLKIKGIISLEKRW